jgi:hypothetical protein
LWTNAEQAAHGNGRRRRKGVQHDASRFAGGDHVNGGRTLQRRNDIRIVERAADEPTGIDAIDRGTKDCGEVFAEPAVKLCQLRELLRGVS